ncbi:MAG TPA: arginine deiminase [Lachnoclostridium sp.]|uniref:arginine deiminase n=1 Tax=Lacrimispora sp. TaxID=2719234 RepID=UPI000EE26D44|nr:arginine deiminase [Lacrimispora sp.]HCD43617.1 arginine deiminase [Lachnoclostridium sp.]
MQSINVKSEIGRLKRVLLHRPGKELLNLTPDTLERLLFDDIPFLEAAQQEHDAFAETLRNNGVEVLYLEDVMAEVLDLNDGIRDEFIKQWINEAGISTELYKKKIYDYMMQFKDDSKALVLKSMEGIVLKELNYTKSGSLVDLMSDSSKLVIDPMPNLYFTRDPFACIGNGVSLNRMYSVTRNRETIYGEYIFKYHPDFKDKVEKYYDRYNAFHIEGGDILNINDKVLAVGISQRTEPDALELLAKNIFEKENSTIKTILGFNIPNSRAFMHLDTVFTQIDYDKFTIHPGILGPLRVYKIEKGNCGSEITVEVLHSDLETILEESLGVDKVELIKCGGEDMIAAEREQWNDGSNTLCISPGTIVTYQRNTKTNELLRQRGLKVLEIPSAELSRGRGGPRCMSMPLDREPVNY